MRFPELMRGSPPVRVLIIAPSSDLVGGQARQAELLVAELRHEPAVEVSFLPTNPRLPGPLRVFQSIKYVRTLSTSLLYVASLVARIRRHDVVHIFSAAHASFVIAPTPALLISKLFRKAVIHTYHSGEVDRISGAGAGPPLAPFARRHVRRPVGLPGPGLRAAPVERLPNSEHQCPGSPAVQGAASAEAGLPVQWGAAAVVQRCMCAAGVRTCPTTL